MEKLNNEQYIYLLVVCTLGIDKTILTYDITPFKNLDAVNDAVLDSLTQNAKLNRGDVDYFSYTPHDNIDKTEYDHICCGKIDFKSGLEKTYKVILRKIH